MSYNVLKLIPAQPSFVPEATDISAARASLADFLPNASEITANVQAGVDFIDPGTNLQLILCPLCGSVVSGMWWQAVMDQAHEIRFANLDVTLPCCGGASTLNDLVYDWPAGFASFTLNATSPEGDLHEEQVEAFERLLRTKLRKIWTHY